MNIRKIAVVGSFAAGAALAFAPLAAADPLTSTVDSEISSLNALFTSDTTLAGVPSTDITGGTTAGSFETIIPSVISAVQDSGTTPFDYLVYGVNPTEAGLASDPGSYNVFNGALTEFDDALNVELYALENGGALDPNAADFIGSMSTIDTALGMANATDAAEYFFNFGLGDLEGFLGIFSSM
jgi:hypothetical protein